MEKFEKTVVGDTASIAKEGMASIVPEGLETNIANKQAELVREAINLTMKNIEDNAQDPYFKNLASNRQALEQHIFELAGKLAVTEKGKSEYADSSAGKGYSQF